MKILLVHNYYTQPGGEDVAFRNEAELLRRYGHQVHIYEEHNSRIKQLNPISLTVGTVWSEPARRRFQVVLKETMPDIVHFQNTFPLISPSAYYACRQAKAAVIQTLQNYRLICPAATLYRDKHVCEDCLGRSFAGPGIIHACYHNSRAHSGVVAVMLATHRVIGTWWNAVDAYIALTEIAKRKFISGGLPPSKIHLKPNFSFFHPGERQERGNFALFVGRLSEEKGIRTMLSAWRSLPIPLKIAGDGPLRDDFLRELNDINANFIEYLGAVPHDEIVQLMSKARLLIFPSEWYEGFPLVLAEAFACGLPILTTNIGSQAEIVEDGYAGLHYRAGDIADLREKALWCFRNIPELLRMGEYARKVYEEKYTPEINYRQLINIYAMALEQGE